MKPWLAVLAALFIHCGSWAALGGAPANLGPQAMATRSSTVSSGMATYTVLRKELDSGTTVHEYVDAGGTVFAVSWSGPFLPDLKEILGVHFEALTVEAVRRKDARRSRLEVRSSDVVIESSGQMRALQGRAWLPSKLPPGFDASAAKWPT